MYNSTTSRSTSAQKEAQAHHLSQAPPAHAMPSRHRNWNPCRHSSNNSMWDMESIPGCVGDCVGREARTGSVDNTSCQSGTRCGKCGWPVVAGITLKRQQPHDLCNFLCWREILRVRTLESWSSTWQCIQIGQDHNCDDRQMIRLGSDEVPGFASGTST